MTVNDEANSHRALTDLLDKRSEFERFRRVERQYSPLHAYLLIREAILRGELAPGALLDERSMMALSDHSRASVREALRRLASNGVVERRKRTGTRVVSQPPLLVNLGSFQSNFSAQVSFTRLQRSDSVHPPVVSGTLDESTNWSRFEGTLIQGSRGIGTIFVYAPENVGSPIQITEGIDEAALPEFFRRAHGVEFGKVITGIDAIRVDAATAEELEGAIAGVSILLVITRSLIDADGVLREEGVAQFSSGKVRIEV